MQNIKLIPLEELKKDLLDSNIDIGICKTALSLGLISYSRLPIEERLRANEYFVRLITTELKRRGCLDNKHD